MAMFSKRLSCFYCGRRPTLTVRGPVRKFHCDHCEADNYLDENGDITDPPASETNPLVGNPDASNLGFKTVESQESDLFCSTCLRNQHLFTHSLAAYLPATDEPLGPQAEREFAEYRKTLEYRYPQICATCEPRARQRIREAGYQAKSDNLRRMMDQTRANRARRHTYAHSWQSLLIFIGAFCYWLSVCGQLAWDAMVFFTAPLTVRDLDPSFEAEASWLACTVQAAQIRHIPGDCAFDLAPLAGIALIAGVVSIWWNPRLRMKLQGSGGRFVGLSEYYQIQLIVLVARGVFWALLKDPAASGLRADLPPALHMAMFIFTCLSVIVSRCVAKYDTRPLVDWSDHSWESASFRPTEQSTTSLAQNHPTDQTSKPANDFSQWHQTPPLVPPQPPQPQVPQPSRIPTPPPEEGGEGMDWTPTASHNFRPMASFHPQQHSVLNGPLPFYGKLPTVPVHPAWAAARAQPSAKPPNQVAEPNPFHQRPSQPQQWQTKPAKPEPVFRPPTFFPSSDHNASTGLEALFDRAFTMEPEDGPKKDWSKRAPRQPSDSASQRRLVFQYLRIILLLLSIGAWTFSQNHSLSIPGNYIEACALGSASLIAGFALLETLKKPLSHWMQMEVLVHITELAAAVHLGAHLPQELFEREYFDRYGKFLLVFMVVQEILGLVAFYRAPTASGGPQGPQPPSSTSPHFGTKAGRQRSESAHQGAIPWSPTESTASGSSFDQSFGTQASAPPLSFGSTAGGSSFSTALPPTQSNFRLSSSNTFNSYPTSYSQSPHSFTMESLKQSDPYSDYDQDSDSETIATTATTRTDATTRNIRYGHNPNNLHSPRRSELGGFSSLSLDDRSPRRATRNQGFSGLSGLSLDDRSPRRATRNQGFSGLSGLSLDDRSPRRMTRSQTHHGSQTPLGGLGRRYPSRVAF